jgi:hypothetical protein
VHDQNITYAVVEKVVEGDAAFKGVIKNQLEMRKTIHHLHIGS